MDFRTFSILFPVRVQSYQLDAKGDFYLCAKPLRLWDAAKDKIVKFKSFKEAWDFEFVKGRTIGSVFADVKNFDLVLEGGGGRSSSKGGVFRFGDGGNGESGMSRNFHFPVEANTRIKTKTEQNAFDYFSSQYRNAGKEYGYAVDAQGYVHRIAEGTKHAVAIAGGKGQMVIHNHPGGGAFSKADLLSTSSTSEAGVIATGKGGDYIFRKTGHFKSEKFMRAVNTAKMRGKNYDEAVKSWLGNKSRQKKYGYMFAFKAVK